MPESSVIKGLPLWQIRSGILLRGIFLRTEQQLENAECITSKLHKWQKNKGIEKILPEFRKMLDNNMQNVYNRYTLFAIS